MSRVELALELGLSFNAVREAWFHFGTEGAAKEVTI